MFAFWCRKNRWRIKNRFVGFFDVIKNIGKKKKNISKKQVEKRSEKTNPFY